MMKKMEDKARAMLTKSGLKLTGSFKIPSANNGVNVDALQEANL